MRSDELFSRATEVIPGGVNSPVRAFRGVGGTPRFIKSARGATITDVDGRTYIESQHEAVAGLANRTEVTVGDYRRCVSLRRCRPIPFAQGARRFVGPGGPTYRDGRTARHAQSDRLKGASGSMSDRGQFAAVGMASRYGTAPS